MSSSRKPVGTPGRWAAAAVLLVVAASAGAQVLPGVGRAVGEHEVVHHIGAQTARHQGSGARHIPIHQHHAAFAGCLQHGAGHHGDLETAQRG